jgi:hypothetical protein
MIRIAVCQSETVVSLTVPVAVTVGMTVPVEVPVQPLTTSLSSQTLPIGG